MNGYSFGPVNLAAKAYKFLRFQRYIEYAIASTNPIVLTNCITADILLTNSNKHRFTSNCWRDQVTKSYKEQIVFISNFISNLSGIDYVM